MRKIILIGLAMVVSPWVFAQPPLPIFRGGNIPPLQKDEGYVLVFVDTGVRHVDVKLNMIAKSGTYFLSGKSAESMPFEHRYLLSLDNKDNGFRWFSLPAGLYQITSVETPFFNLPYKYNTSKYRIWRIAVRPNEINYIGRLKVKDARTRDSISAKLLNRIAADRKAVESNIPEALAKYPLVGGAGYRDDFSSVFGRAADEN